MRGLISRFLGFGLIPGLSMLASLVLLPIISSYDGSVGWASVSVGQSIGALISVIAGLTWPIVGTQLVIEAKNSVERAEIFWLSLLSRGLILSILVVCAIPVVLSVSAHLRFGTVALFMFGVALNALSASWFYAGIGKPKFLIDHASNCFICGNLCAICALGRGFELFHSVHWVWYSTRSIF